MYTGSSALVRAWYALCNRKAWILSSLIVAAFLLLMTAAVYAQTVASDDDPPIGGPPSQPIVEPSVTAPPLSPALPGELAEVTRDETITHEDFGTVEAGVLPDSPFHIFKRFGWGIQEAFTFDPVRDAELKLQHANQQLSEVKQLLDEKGFTGVRPAVIESAIGDAQDKIGEIRDTVDALKDAKDTQPEVVDRLLNEVADKQIKQQRVLDIIAKEAIEVRAAVEQGTVELTPAVAQELDRVVAKAEETKDDSVAAMTDVLVGVEDSAQSVGVRITNVLDRQAGSEFKELKHLEILAAVKEQMPEEAKSAIEVAQNNTMQKFEAKVKELPPVVRAEKFKLYVEGIGGDETKLLALLDQIKQAPGVPTDVLSKVEEAKEIAVKKFERKLKLMTDKRSERQMLDRLTSDNVDDLVVLGELESRMSQDVEEFKQVEDARAKSMEQFKESFSGANEEQKAGRFQALSRAMLTRPTPKTMRLVAVLEAEVGEDVDRQVFVEQLTKDMKRQFEGQFRREGDKFMERMATLDPNDMEVFQQFDFDKQFVDGLTKRNASKFKDYMKVVDDPDDFDTFHERFFEMPKDVVENIRANDSEFQNTMQFKVRTMETVRLEKDRKNAQAQLELKERDVVFQSSREERKANDKFYEELGSISFDDFDKRKTLWEGKINDAYARTEQQYNERRKIFEERSKLDPWCDGQCQQIQLQFVEQNLRHEKERLSDDLSREQRRIELDQVKTKRVAGQEGAFGQGCDSVESCEAYCKANPAVVLCKGFITGPVVQICRYPSYWDSATKGCVTSKDVAPLPEPPMEPSCPTGQYFDYRGNACVADPYYRATAVFQTCSYGTHWNEKNASCELDRAIYIPPTPIPGEPGRPIGTAVYPDYYPADNVFCGTDFRWDGGRRECVPRNLQTCPTGQYYDFHDNGCKQEWKDCGAGSYWDPGKNTCVKNTYQPVPGGECPVGFRKDAAGVCVSEWSDIPSITVFCKGYNEVWNPATRKCESMKAITYCIQEYAPVCGTDGATYSNECYAKQAGIAVKSTGACQKTIEPKPVIICPANKYNYQGTYSCDTSACPGGCGYDANGCPSSCAGGINPTCPTGQQWDNYARTCKPVSGTCKISCEQPCGGSSYCIFDNAGCATGCSPSCTSPAWYDTELKKCVTQKDRDAAFGCTGGQYWDSYFKTCRDQYCPSGWKWDTASYACVSTTDPSCKSSCGDTCSGGSWCMFDQKGCATGCSPTCPQNQYYDQYQKKCVGYYTPTTCSDNGFNSGSGSSSCNYTKCPSGCNYDDKGCPSACYTPQAANCTDNGYNVKGTASCDYTKCKSGCSFDTKACPTGCYTPPVCPDNGYGSSYTGTDGAKYTSCNYTKCPSGCNYDNSSCPTGCYQSGGSGGSCGGGAGVLCPAGYTCVYPSGPAYADMMGTCTISTTPACNNNKVCDSGETAASCPGDCGSTYPGDATSCPGFAYSNWDSKGVRYCKLNNSFRCEYNYPAYLTESNYTAAECPSPLITDPGCGDRMCNNGETYATCPADCSSTTNCGTGYTWNATVNSCVKTGVTCSNSSACSACTGSTNNYSQSWCEYDFNGCPSGCKSSSSVCGDKVCSGSETSYSCPTDCTSSSSCPATIANNYQAGVKTCYSTTCTKGCNYDNGGCPSTCLTSTSGYCGDKICQSNEGSSNCPGDCGSTSTCTPNVYNANTNVKWACDSSTYCKSGCTFDANGCATSCQTTGGTCSPNIYNANATATWSCDNAYCKSGCHYTAAGCADACTTTTSAGCAPTPMSNNSTSPWLCSITICPSGCNYDTSGCATSCKTSTTGGTCPSTIANNYTSSNVCYSTTCTGGCNYDGQGCPSSCWSSSGYCGDYVCQSSETSATCPADCGGATTTTCPSTTANGNTTSMACNYTNCPNGCTWSGSCPSGCMSGTSTGSCGDAICNNAETSATCPADCGSAPVATICPSNGYNTAAGSYACNYTTCPNGCTYGSDGCPSGCTASLCTDNSFNMPGTMTCNMTTCPHGCTWGSNGCPSGCYTSTTPHAGFFRRLGSILYALITLPARAFGL